MDHLGDSLVQREDFSATRQLKGEAVLDQARFPQASRNDEISIQIQ